MFLYARWGFDVRLLIDVGNTRIKWAVIDPQRILPHWDAARGMVTGWQAYGAVAHGEPAAMIESWHRFALTDAVIANVAGAKVRQQLGDLLQDDLGLSPQRQHWFAATACVGGVRNGYRDPAQLGCDRFAALVGARALFPGQRLIVVTCGTATTIDALEPDGQFVGGMILPGLAMMATSLARSTAHLPQVDTSTAAMAALFANHTDAAIASGCLSAQVGAIERACHALHETLCLISGGAAGMIAPALSVPYHLVDNLVLPGLQAACNIFPSCKN